jgi:hypothetical protein
MRIKGQTAMEYLMTYGWAILIIIVVVAALYAMGVFSIKGGVACSPCFSYFAYRDYDTTNDIVYIRNGARTIDTLTFTAPATAGVGPTVACTVVGISCDPGSDIDITGIDAASAPVVVQISYRDVSSGVTHTDTATIHEK